MNSLIFKPEYSIYNKPCLSKYQFITSKISTKPKRLKVIFNGRFLNERMSNQKRYILSIFFATITIFISRKKD